MPEKIEAVCRYIINPQKIAQHPFMPLIRREVVSHPYRKNPETGKKERKNKKRELTYASHLESQIFSYYAYKLQEKYEQFVEQNDLNDVAVAYRKIKSLKGGNKCNIHIAGDVFQYIKEQLQVNDKVAVITFDIKGFFDNLDHTYLKRAWKKIMGYVDMPEDEYAVFKHTTKYSFVKEERMFELFRNQIWCESCDKYVKKRVPRIEYLHSKKAIAYCERKDIEIIRQSGFIQRNTQNKGIPQGLPISAVLANIYMAEFDVEANTVIQKAGGIYKRYSDDIIVVCPIAESKRIRDYIIDYINNVKLEIQINKTNLFEITNDHGKVICNHETQGTKQKIEYLGFSFDGEHILIKSSGLSKYFYKMWRSKRRHKRWAISIHNNTNGIVFEHSFYKRYTLAGSVRHHIRHKKGKMFIKTRKKSYGNYLTYVCKASNVLGEPSIKRQLRKNLSRVRKSIAEIYLDINHVKQAKGH